MQLTYIVFVLLVPPHNFLVEENLHQRKGNRLRGLNSGSEKSTMTSFSRKVVFIRRWVKFNEISCRQVGWSRRFLRHAYSQEDFGNDDFECCHVVASYCDYPSFFSPLFRFHPPFLNHVRCYVCPKLYSPCY